MEYNIRSYAFRRRISICTKVLMKKKQFFVSSYHLRNTNIFNFWPWKFRLMSRGRKRDLRHSIANIHLHESHTEHFCASYYCLRDINILIFFGNIGRGHVVEKRVLRHSIANVNLHKSRMEHSCASFYCLRDISTLNFWPWKFRSRSRRTKTGFTPSIANVWIYIADFLNIFSCPATYKKLTNLTYTHIRTYT